MEKAQKFFKIKEISQKTGLTERALRFYEDINLISPGRTKSGYRLYSEEHLEKIQRIMELKQSLGFSLNDIRELLELEKDLALILKEKEADVSLIEKSMAEVEKKIRLIEAKELTLQSAKAGFQEILSKLEDLHKELTIKEVKKESLKRTAGKRY